MLIVFLGPPGAGKGTQAQHLMEALRSVHLSTGELLRQAKEQGTELGQVAAQFIDQGELVPDEVVVAIVSEELTGSACSTQGCLLDGFPRTLAQAKELDQCLARLERRLDLVLSIEVDEDELTQRVLKRAAIEGRVDDTPETFANRLAVYHRQTEPLIEYYRQSGILVDIDGNGTPQQVFSRVQAAIEQSGGLSEAHVISP